MEHFVFPAAFYKDEENDNYIVAFDDVRVYCMGKTIEEAYWNAKKYLKDYCRLSVKMFGEVQEKPRTFLESLEIHKNEIVLLIDAEVKGSKKEEEDLI
jgi:hypothetical protein